MYIWDWEPNYYKLWEKWCNDEEEWHFANLDSLELEEYNKDEDLSDEFLSSDEDHNDSNEDSDFSEPFLE